MRKIAVAFAGIGLAAALLTGCAETAHGSGLGEGAAEPQPTNTAAPGPAGSPVEAAAAQLSVQTMITAGTTAQDAVDDSTVVAIASRHTGGYKVVVATSNGGEESMTTSANGAKLLSDPVALQQTDAQTSAEQQLLNAAEVQFSDAATNASQAVPGGTIQQLSLQKDPASGALSWQAKIITELGGVNTVQLSALNGEVTHNTILD